MITTDTMTPAGCIRVRRRKAPAHQVPGAVPGSFKTGDRITYIGRPESPRRPVAMVITDVQPSPKHGIGSFCVAYAHINARGKLTGHAGSMLLENYLDTEGRSWFWWVDVRPQPCTQPTGRRRLIHVEGDGASVFRVARKFCATAEVYVSPNGDTHADQLNHPGLSLSVTPDGGWSLRYLPPVAGNGDRVPVTLASGHIDHLPGVCEHCRQAIEPDKDGYLHVDSGEYPCRDGWTPEDDAE